MPLVVNHDNAGVLRDLDGLAFDITNLPTPRFLLEIMQQELISLEDNECFGHLFAFFDLKAIVFFLNSRKIGTFTVHVFFIELFYLLSRSGGCSWPCWLWFGNISSLFFLDYFWSDLLVFGSNNFDSVIVVLYSQCCHLILYNCKKAQA